MVTRHGSRPAARAASCASTSGKRSRISRQSAGNSSSRSSTRTSWPFYTRTQPAAAASAGSTSSSTAAASEGHPSHLLLVEHIVLEELTRAAWAQCLTHGLYGPHRSAAPLMRIAQVSPLYKADLVVPIRDPKSTGKLED